MDDGGSEHVPPENFYVESIRKTFQRMIDVPEPLKPNLERKAVYLVQLALLGDYAPRKIMSIIEG